MDNIPGTTTTTIDSAPITTTANSALQFDNIISAQPNIGPNIPDGGYGWIIVIIVSFFKAFIPSIIAGYGIFFLFRRIELTPPDNTYMWNVKFIYVPIVYLIASTIAEPISRKLIIGNRWPLYICYAGTCLTCAGLVLLWFALRYVSNHAAIYIISGLLTGIGTSILKCVCEIIIKQYFKLKLQSVETVLQAINCLGFVFVPIFLGNFIVLYGITHTLLWYAIIIMQGLIICLLIRKPPYLKNQPTTYKLIRDAGEEEEDIFSKTITELKTTGNTEEQQKPSTSNDKIVKNWERFDDTNHTYAFPSTSSDEPIENNHIDDAKSGFEDNFNGVQPKPLYEEIMEVYNIPANPSLQTSNLCLNIQDHQLSTIDELKRIMKEPTTYKSIVHLISFKFSTIVYFILYPSYIENKINYLKVYHTTTMIGVINISGLILVIISFWVKNDSNKRAIFLAGLSWFGALGYIMIADVKTEVFFIVGGIFACFSIFALEYHGEPLMKVTLRGETTMTHVFLSIVTSISLLLFFITDFQFVTWFKLASVMQFINGSMWFSNFIYKRLKSLRGIS